MGSDSWMPRKRTAQDLRSRWLLLWSAATFRADNLAEDLRLVH